MAAWRTDLPAPASGTQCTGSDSQAVTPAASLPRFSAQTCPAIADSNPAPSPQQTDGDRRERQSWGREADGAPSTGERGQEWKLLWGPSTQVILKDLVGTGRHKRSSFTL